MAVKLTPQRKVLAVAASQIGYSRWNDPNRGTKYARETQPVFWPKSLWLLANGISFCDLFVTWVFWKALGEDFVNNHLPGGASYNTDYRASKGGRISRASAQPGDILVFDWNWNTLSTNHVGILEKRLSGSRFQTIEGNTSVGSGGSQGNGGRVARRVRRHSQVRYVIRPDWKAAGGPSLPAAKEDPWETSPLVRAMSESDVKSVQTLLRSLGYDLGSYGVDGSYGRDTYNAVRAAQKKLGVSVDGVAGPVTIAALRKAAGKAPANNLDVTDDTFDLDTGRALQRYLNKYHGAKLKVDGKVGIKTWMAFQRAVNAPYVDGEISRQSHKASTLGPALTQGWEYTGADSEGSQTIEKLQSWVGVKQDGILGPKTIRALKVKLNSYDLK